MAASDWKDHWINAIEACNEKDYVSAEKSFNLAISEMEQAADREHPYVYVDRARLYLLLNRYKEVLPDVEVALSYANLKDKEKLRALVTRISAKAQLGISEGVLEDMKYIGENYAPTIENTEKKLILRNVPDCDCYQKIMTCYLVHSGICNSKNDIKMLKSGMWVVNKASKSRSQDCDETKVDAFLCDACGEALIDITSPQCGIDGCKVWCDANTITATAWCTKVFKTPHCQASCLLAVYGIQQGCYWCCEGGSVYKKCIKPFGQIVDYIKEPCDPYWD